MGMAWKRHASTNDMATSLFKSRYTILRVFIITATLFSTVSQAIEQCSASQRRSLSYIALCADQVQATGECPTIVNLPALNRKNENPEEDIPQIVLSCCCVTTADNTILFAPTFEVKPPKPRILNRINPICHGEQVRKGDVFEFNILTHGNDIRANKDPLKCNGNITVTSCLKPGDYVGEEPQDNPQICVADEADARTALARLDRKASRKRVNGTTGAVERPGGTAGSQSEEPEDNNKSSPNVGRILSILGGSVAALLVVIVVPTIIVLRRRRRIAMASLQI